MVLTRALAAVAVAALLLAGCAARPGVAAVVDGEPISEAVLAETSAQLADISAASPRGVLQALVVSPFWIRAAAATGLGASEQEARIRLDQLAVERGGEAGGREYGEALLGIARVLLAQEKALEAGREAELAGLADRLVSEAEIEVSPRYGTWTEQGITAQAWPWLIGSAPGAS